MSTSIELDCPAVLSSGTGFEFNRPVGSTLSLLYRSSAFGSARTAAATRRVTVGDAGSARTIPIERPPWRGTLAPREDRNWTAAPVASSPTPEKPVPFSTYNRFTNSRGNLAHPFRSLLWCPKIGSGTFAPPGHPSARLKPFLPEKKANLTHSTHPSTRGYCTRREGITPWRCLRYSRGERSPEC